MVKENLNAGLKYVLKHNLSPGEASYLLRFIERDYCSKELSKVVGLRPESFHHFITRLKLKGLIKVKEKIKGNIYYTFKEESMEE